MARLLAAGQILLAGTTDSVKKVPQILFSGFDAFCHVSYILFLRFLFILWNIFFSFHIRCDSILHAEPNILSLLRPEEFYCHEQRF